jgi:hypothetical protein
MGFNSFEFANSVCTSLLGNLSTLAAGNSTLNIWTQSTGDLNAAWQTGPSPMTSAINKISDKDSLQNIINELNDPNQFCTSDISLLLQKLATYGDFSSGGTGPTQMSEIQTFGNLVSATQQIQTSTGDTESKSQASFIQQTTSSQQPIADMGNSAIGILGSVSSMLMQSFL